MVQAKSTDNNTLDLYFRDISASTPLSIEEEVELARKVRAGDLEARNRLVSANLRFVVSLAGEYQGYGVDLEDLIGAGNMGLITAAERFDETRGFKFICYAAWWIRRAIRKALIQQARMIRLPTNRVGLLQRVSKLLQKIGQTPGTETGSDALAIQLGVSREMMNETLNLAQPVRSLDAPLNLGDDTLLMHNLPDPAQPPPDLAISRASDRRQVKKALHTLEERERSILRLYFGMGDSEPHTLEQIGTHLSLTRERVRQIKERALRKLRHPKRRKHLDPLRDPL